MFELALVIGIYSYLILTLGLLYLLSPVNIFIFSVLFFVAIYFLYGNRLSFRVPKFKLSRFEKVLLTIFLSQVFINLIGALGPELSFDALWYHLTFPKIYLQNHGIFYVPGGLLYYSGIPKLTELIYTSLLAFGSEILPKLAHFAFALLICLVLLKISRKFLNKTFSLLVVLLFYSNLVVAWESTTAYVDLARGFFEVMALWGFLNFEETKKNKDLILSSVMLGLAIASKLMSLLTIPIFVGLIFLQKGEIRKKIKKSAFFSLISIFIALPWFVFSLIHTGNPIYPLITNYETGQNIGLLNPLNFIKSIFLVFTHSPDPLSPFYIIVLPFVILFARRIYNSRFRAVFVYSVLALIAWYFTPHPQTGGGRYIIPFLPAFSLLSIYALSLIEYKKLKMYLIVLLVFLSSVSVLYRGVANFRYVPVVLGVQKKADFLSKHLNFSFGDFYDTDNYFKTHLMKSDRVLLYGFHNLYYVNFNFIDSSWVKKGDEFNYIATQEAVLPDRFSFWNLVYYNPKTHVKLYSIGGKTWIY